MDVKKKLVELMCDVLEDGCMGHCNHPPCWKVTHAVDGLIAHGVTVQELDGCEYCNDPHPARDCVLPDGTERFLAGFEDGTFLGKPFIYERKIKFCPMCGRRLPQPPKGE